MPLVVDARDYSELFRKTRDLEPAIRKALRKRLREAAAIGQRAAQETIATWPSHHAGTLRVDLARNIRVSVTARDVRIRQRDIGRPGWRRVGKDIDRGRWRHPVYGSGNWVTQSGIHYFADPIRRQRIRMLYALQPVFDDIRREIK